MTAARQHERGIVLAAIESCGTLSIAPDDRFQPFYKRASSKGWGATEIDASHNAHIACQRALAERLNVIARSILAR
jgi:hypothetical protein